MAYVRGAVVHYSGPELRLCKSFLAADELPNRMSRQNAMTTRQGLERSRYEVDLICWNILAISESFVEVNTGEADFILL